MVRRVKNVKNKRIAECLKAELLSMGMHHGDPVISARELAQHYGVSVPTAHNALNMLVKEGLLYRVQGSGTFYNSPEKKSLRIGLADESLQLEFIPPDLNRILNNHFIHAAEFFHSEGCSVRMISYSELLQGEVLKDLDGLLISCMFLDKKTFKLISSSGIPVVAYRYNHPNQYPVPYVTYDLKTGIREALERISPDSNSRFHLVYETIPYGIHAKNLWQEHLEKLGIPQSQITVTGIETETREVSCYRLVRVYPERFQNSIILVSDDELAVNLVNALTLEGFEQGREYQLVGIGNRAEYGFESAKKLKISSIDLPINKMAEEAAKLLLYRIANPSECGYAVMVPTHFIFQGTE